tara:strand:+ start:4740 stop:4991 length:252 start_codon:yes stop_codon:yes gene_type:complete
MALFLRKGNITSLALDSNSDSPVYIYPPNSINYTELGIFISGLILSVGGFLSLILGSIRRSNCKTVSCCCFNCKRENLDIGDN